MPLGAIASQQGTGDTGDTEAGMLDFVNDVYFGPSGEALALADVVDLTARRSASGLSCVASTPVQLIGAWRDLLITSSDWSAVIEFYAGPDLGLTGAARRAYLLTMHPTADYSAQIALYTEGDGTGVTSRYFEDDGVGNDRFAQNAYSGTPSTVLTIAGGRSDINFAVSIGGETAVTDSTDIAFDDWLLPAGKIDLADGGSGVGGTYIRSITFSVPAISNSELATSTA